jgi:uncharacterized protein YxeA
MKKLILSSIALIFFYYNSSSQELSPYIKIGESTATMQQVSAKIIDVLNSNNYEVLGNYNPSNKNTLQTIVFTNAQLKNTVIKVTDRGALAAAVKIGLVKKNGKIVISYTNPDYFLRAYLRDNYNSFKTVFQNFSNNLKTNLSPIGNEFIPFGGSIQADKLKKYHYKIMMPYFTDPVELNEYASFDEGLKIIENNLIAKKGNTVQVYKLIYKDQKVAVFGIALLDQEDGESYFLPKIGEDHIAAMPYEIILQGNKVTMLHGKYRLALHWPELSMGTFMKIMSTPGNIEDMLKGICETENQ